MSVEGVDFGSVALSAAARDLTAPLVLLRQLSFQLDSQLGENESSAVSQALAQIRLTVGRTFDIAEQLRLAVADTEDLILEPVQLTGLCQDVSSGLQPLAHELRCSLDFELPRRQSVVAVGNYQALKTVILGFLTDAVRYSRSDGEEGSIDGSPAPERIVRVRVATSRAGLASITIDDNGPELNLAKALAMAEQVSNTNPATTRPLMGSLNLLLANRLMQAMHGQLRVHNHRHGGVTIETCLPISHQMSLLEAA